MSSCWVVCYPWNGCCDLMDADGCASGWLLLLAQLPSSPSSARVALWRRLRAVGAAGVLNGAWVLPHTAVHAEFFDTVLARLAELRNVL